MKKHTIELFRSKDCPVGYGLMRPFNLWNSHEKANDFCIINGYILGHIQIREEEEFYTDGRFIKSTGWTGGKDKLSHEYFCGCEWEPEKIRGWKFCDHIVYLDIFYYDNDEVLKENLELKNELK